MICEACKVYNKLTSYCGVLNIKISKAPSHNLVQWKCKYYLSDYKRTLDNNIEEISCTTCKYGKGQWMCKEVFLSNFHFNPILDCINREYYYWESSIEKEFLKESEMMI